MKKEEAAKKGIDLGNYLSKTKEIKNKMFTIKKDIIVIINKSLTYVKLYVMIFH